jgi:PAS domain S-box-containing protein
MGKSTYPGSTERIAIESVPIPALRCTSRTVHDANAYARRAFNLKRKKLPATLQSCFDDAAASGLRRLILQKEPDTRFLPIGDRVYDVNIIQADDGSALRDVLLTDVSTMYDAFRQEKQSAEMFRAIVENSGDGISIVHQDRFLYVNKKFLDIFGYTESGQLIGKPIASVVADEERSRVGSISRGRQHGEAMPVLYSFKGKKRDGTAIEVEVVASRIEYDGRPSSLSFHRDVTERNRLEKRLVEAEEFRENVFFSLEQGVVVFDNEFRCIDWNNQMDYFIGLERQRALGSHAKDIFRKFDDHGVIDKLKNVLSGTKVSFGYLPYLHPVTKQMRYAWLNLSPLVNTDGVVRGIVGVLSDLTHQKFMQDEIKESETLFRNVLEAMGDALVLTDLQGRVLRVNKEFERITGYREDEALGQSIPYSWFYEPDTARFVVWIAELREKNFLHDFDIRWKSKDNHIIPVSLNTTLLRNKEGDPVAMLNIARDITDRKKLETELQNRTQQIELINHVISKANETIEIKDLLQTLQRELRQLIEFSRFGIVLIREEHMYDEVTFTASGNDIYREERTGPTTSIGSSVRQWVKPFASNNLAHDKKIIRDLPLYRLGYQSLVAVPIYSKDTFLGVLYIAQRETGSFVGSEIGLLQPICEQIGLIVDKLHLFTRVRDDAQYIHNLLDSMDDLVFTVNNELIVTESNTAAATFPFKDTRIGRRKNKSLIGYPLYRVIAKSPYREGLEQVIDALFSENIKIYTTEFSYGLNGEERTFHLRINPMKIEGRIVGLVFTHTDITNLKKTEEELKRRNRDLIELNEISALLTKSLKLEDVYEIALTKIQQMFSASIVSVYLIHDKSIRLSGYAGPLTRKEVRTIGEIDLHRSLVGEVFRTGKPLSVTRNMGEMPEVSPEWQPLITKYKLQSSVTIPLILGKNVRGALNIDFNHERTFSRQEMDLLVLIGNQLSAAIENIRLYESINERVNDLTILASLGNIYASSLDINEIAESVVDRIKSLRDPDILSITLIDKVTKRLRLVSSRGISEDKLSHEYETADPIIDKIIRNKQDVIIENLEADDPELLKVLIRKDHKSIGLFLLQTEGEVIGVLSIGFTRINKFQPEDIALYRNIATQLSMALHNAQLYQKIQDSEEKYRLLVETAQDMVISMDLDGTFTYVSPSSEFLTGYTPAELLRLTFSPRMIHPGDYRYINKLMRLAAQSRVGAEPVRAFEFRIRTKNSVYRWMSASWTLVHDARGQVTGVQCILRDVHERRLAEEEITQQLKRLRVLYDLAHALAATLEISEILGAVSGSMRKVLPHRCLCIYLYQDGTPEVLHRVYKTNARDGDNGAQHPVVMQLDREMFDLERKVLNSRTLLERSGSWKEPHKIVAPMLTKEKVLGLIVLESEGSEQYTDIHKNLLQTIAHQTGISIEKAMLYKETVDKSLEIQKRNRELDDFTYVVSHDLKEPLISIEGYSKILLADYQDILANDGHELLSSIQVSCSRMKNLINELLTLSRVGRLTESMSTVRTDEVLKEIIDDLEFTLKKKNGCIILPRPLPEVRGNRVHLVILFRNLIINGIKFNTSDRPIVKVVWEEEGDFYRFAVTDNGIGIDREYFDKIFVIFHRLRSDVQYEGTGAGLTIVKKIVETHGGDIWLDSEIGKGTTFYFTLPKT